MMRELNARRKADGKLICNIGIGVHCGEVVHGFVGALEAMGFTVIGEAVNRTASYCQSANAGEVIVSRELYEHVWRIIEHADPITSVTKDKEHLSAYLVRDLKPQQYQTGT
jgi:adenylate cyclase